MKLKKSNFTLIELLVVIGIIGILMAILLPVISQVRHRSHVLHSQATAIDLAVAVDKYLMEYGDFPIPHSGSDIIDLVVDDNLLDILDRNNPRKIKFYTIQRPFKNVWKGDFFISIDANRDNQVTADGITYSGNVVVYAKYKDEVMGSWHSQK